MINKPRCAKATVMNGGIAIYCNGEFLCAHQYYCPQTRRYENTAGFGVCHRLNPPAPKAEETKSETVLTVPMAEVKKPEPVSTETSAIGVERYVQNVIPKKDTTDEPKEETVSTETTTNTKSERRQTNGQVRNPGRRGRKKG